MINKRSVAVMLHAEAYYCLYTYTAEPAVPQVIIMWLLLLIKREKKIKVEFLDQRMAISRATDRQSLP